MSVIGISFSPLVSRLASSISRSFNSFRVRRRPDAFRSTDRSRADTRAHAEVEKEIEEEIEKENEKRKFFFADADASVSSAPADDAPADIRHGKNDINDTCLHSFWYPDGQRNEHRNDHRNKPPGEHPGQSPASRDEAFIS